MSFCHCSLLLVPVFVFHPRNLIVRGEDRVEGHVPFADIRRLLAERPDARGIAVPGMPLGSPGMEAHTSQSFTTRLVGRDGRISDYAHHPGDDPSR